MIVWSYEMRVCRRLLTICVACVLVAPSLPGLSAGGAGGERDSSRDGSQLQAGAADPAALPYAPARDPQSDLRGPRATSALPGLLGLHDSVSPAFRGRVALADDCAYPPSPAPSLLSLHCLLVV